jgi:hypothetical protein
MVGVPIQRKFGIKLSKASVCRPLNQLGLTPQRPMWRAYQQCPDRVKRWLEEEYPAIQALARKEKARIFFAECRCSRGGRNGYADRRLASPCRRSRSFSSKTRLPDAVFAV